MAVRKATLLKLGHSSVAQAAAKNVLLHDIVNESFDFTIEDLCNPVNMLSFYRTINQQAGNLGPIRVAGHRKEDARLAYNRDHRNRIVIIVFLVSRSPRKALRQLDKLADIRGSIAVPIGGGTISRSQCRIIPLEIIYESLHLI